MADQVHRESTAPTHSPDDQVSQNTSSSYEEPVQLPDFATSALTSLARMMTEYDKPLNPSSYPVYIRRLRTLSALPDLVDALIAQYNATPPSFVLLEELEEWNRNAKILIRLRVMHFITTWIEYYWLSGVDDDVLPALKTLIYQSMGELAPLLGDHVKDIVHARIQSMEKGIRRRGFIHSVHIMSMLIGQAPSVIIANERLLLMLQQKEFNKVAIVDFDPIELAQQLTIIESNLYCAIRPEDMLQDDFGLSSSVRAIDVLNTQITNWVSECILNEVQPDNRKKFMEFILSVAEACMELYNFSTSSSILAAFETPIISRLNRTFSTLHDTAKTQLASLKTLMDPSQDHIEYRRRIQDTVPPAVPCLGLYIADAIYCRESYRHSDINQRGKLVHFKKYSKFSQILREMQRFQTPYRLTVIPEIQEYLTNALNKTRVTSVPNLPQTPDINISLKSVRSSLTDKTTSLYSIYSIASSRTASTDYGFYYTRHAISQDVLDVDIVVGS